MGRNARIPRVADRGRIVAHRGASQAAPENTLAAIDMAARMGCTWVEFDLTLFGDGTPVLHHDDRLGRVATSASLGEAALADLTAADLGQIDAGSWRAPEFTGERIPLLEEALDLVEAHGLHANLELKPHGLSRETAAAALEALARRPWAQSRVLVSSFDLDALTAFREGAPDQPMAVLFKKPGPGWVAEAERLRAGALHLNFRNLTASLLHEAARHGIDVRVYTINDPVLMQPFWAEGLTGVITDHPPLFMAAGAIPEEIPA